MRCEFVGQVTKVELLDAGSYSEAALPFAGRQHEVTVEGPEIRVQFRVLGADSPRTGEKIILSVFTEDARPTEGRE